MPKLVIVLSSGLKLLLALLPTVQCAIVVMSEIAYCMHCFVTDGPKCKSVVNSDIAFCFVQSMPRYEAVLNSDIASCFGQSMLKCGIRSEIAFCFLFRLPECGIVVMSESAYCIVFLLELQNAKVLSMLNLPLVLFNTAQMRICRQV